MHIRINQYQLVIFVTVYSLFCKNLRNSLLFGVFRLRSCSVQHLEEVCRLSTHSRMNINFTAFNMIVQIIPKHVYQVDGIVARFPIGMTWKQYCKNIK